MEDDVFITYISIYEHINAYIYILIINFFLGHNEENFFSIPY